ncbi:MAG: hypothetical protein ABIR28_11050, partial [Vicinamibacteria bacterium]
ETGNHVWHEDPEGREGYVYLSPLTAAYGRLYYVDFSFRTYCYEEVNPSDPDLIAQRAREAIPSLTESTVRPKIRKKKRTSAEVTVGCGGSYDLRQESPIGSKKKRK